MYDSEEWCSPPQIEIIRISEVFNPIVNNAEGHEIRGAKRETGQQNV